MIDREIIIDTKKVGADNPVYFIADIASNHDGDLNRAKDLIYLAAESGADAAKFQHFTAETIVSDYGFKSLGSKQSHQLNWNKSVFEIYKDASIDIKWTNEIFETCKKAGITFLTSPYSIDLVEKVDPYVPAFKIGSGDITWIEMIEHIAKKGKPYIIATGASNIDDVKRAVNKSILINPKICLMQCNTNYTGSIENFKYINLNVLKSYSELYPDIILGLSDHTPGNVTVLGAVAFGAKIIEKHFTDDISRQGPDHRFSMNANTWREMVERTRELELSIGRKIKKIEENEKETVVLQRRSVRLIKSLKTGDEIELNHLKFLRPCPSDSIPPYMVNNILGKKIKIDKNAGDYLKWQDIE